MDMSTKTYVDRLNRIRLLNTEDPDFVITDVYRLLLKEQSLISGYERIKSNKASVTPAIGGDTLDDFGRERLDRLRTRLADESWQPRPARRVDIPKPGKLEKGPLGVQGPEEKIVQASMLSILEAIYEPIFSNNSYGFRPGRNAHDALKAIYERYDGVSYIVEGDIKGMYDHVNHKVLISLLEKKIRDARFIRLVWKMLRAGYMDTDDTILKPILGRPQGSIVSPILANVYLHELDKFMEGKCSGRVLGRTKPKTPVYHKINYKIRTLSNLVDQMEPGTERDEKLKELRATKMKGLETRIYRDPAPRVYYSRYADDFIIGIAGPQDLALSLRDQVKHFLSHQLGLTLNLEKTKITNPKVSKAIFLGYEIFIDSREKMRYVHSKGHTPFLRKTTGRFIKLGAPIESIVKGLQTKGFCDGNGHPTPKRIWITQEDHRIVDLYRATINGIFNYYKGCHYQHRLGRIWYILQFSCAMTLASKHRSSISKVFKKHGSKITVRHGKAGEKSISLFKPLFREESRKW